jgi:predicted ATP-grasp superfamily ATP-dependent carboligase
MKGIFNIEFKRDTRDNSLKVIESNPRITAAQELLLRSGVDFSEIIYRDLTGQELVVSDGDSHQYGLTYWYPRRDFAAFRASRRAGEIGWGQWIHQVSRRHVFPYFQFSDPMPTLVRTYRLFRNKIKKILT